MRSPQGAPGLWATVVQPVLDRYDTAFAEVRDRATDRFLYVAHLTDLLRDDRLALKDIAALPVGSGLYSHYLRQLQLPLVGTEEPLEESTVEHYKLWAFMRRVILTLTAAQQAHVVFQQMLPDSVRDEVFRGVPLGILAALLDEPSRSVRLVHTLYSLKTVLAVWKGEDSADAHYALGLKDFSGAVAALWPEALQQTHRLLANQTLEALEGRWETVTDDQPLDRWRLLNLVAHAECAEDLSCWEILIGAEAIKSAYSRISKSLQSQINYRVAIFYGYINLIISKKRLQKNNSQVMEIELALVIKDLAEIFFDQSLFIYSETFYRESLAIYQDNFGHDYRDLGIFYTGFSKTLRELGKYGEAEFLARKSIEINTKNIGYYSAPTATGFNALGLNYSSENRLKESEEAHRKALEIRLKVLPPEDFFIAASYNNMATISADKGAYKEAEKLHRKALNIKKKIFPKNHPSIGISLCNLGRVLHLLGKWDESEIAFRESLLIRTAVFGVNHLDTSVSLNGLGELLCSQGRLVEAKQLVRDALTCQLEEKPNFKIIYNSNLGAILVRQDRLEEALIYYEIAIENIEKLILISQSSSGFLQVFLDQFNYIYEEYLSILQFLYLKNTNLGYEQKFFRCCINHPSGIFAQSNKEDSKNYLSEFLRKDQIEFNFMEVLRVIVMGLYVGLNNIRRPHGSILLAVEEKMKIVNLILKEEFCPKLKKLQTLRKPIKEINFKSVNWSQASIIYIKSEEADYFYRANLLLEAASWQWTYQFNMGQVYISKKSTLKLKNHLIQFLDFYDYIQSQWTIDKGNAEPPWHKIIIKLQQASHQLNQDQRAFLLKMLRDQSDQVKKLLDW